MRICRGFPLVVRTKISPEHAKERGALTASFTSMGMHNQAIPAEAVIRNEVIPAITRSFPQKRESIISKGTTASDGK